SAQASSRRPAAAVLKHQSIHAEPGCQRRLQVELQTHEACQVTAILLKMKAAHAGRFCTMRFFLWLLRGNCCQETLDFVGTGSARFKLKIFVASSFGIIKLLGVELHAAKVRAI